MLRIIAVNSLLKTRLAEIKIGLMADVAVIVDICCRRTTFTAVYMESLG